MHFKENEKAALNSSRKVRYGLLNSYSLWSISQMTIFSIPFGSQTLRDYDSPSFFSLNEQEPLNWIFTTHSFCSLIFSTAVEK